MANNYKNFVAEKKVSGNFDIEVLSALNETGRQKKRREFFSFVENIDWSVHGPTELRHALDVALFLDMVPLSRELAQKGVDLFPGNSDFQYFVKVLAPPKVIGTSPAKKRHFAPSYEWLNNNADKYRGHWLAVCRGKLVATSLTYKDLKKKIANSKTTDDTIVVQVPA